MTDWIEASELAVLAVRDVTVRGRSTVVEELAMDPQLMLAVGPLDQPPVDLATYRVRLARAEAGNGPPTHGLREFVHYLERAQEPGRAVVVSGARTTYTLVVDEHISRIVAGVAVDRPCLEGSPLSGPLAMRVLVGVGWSRLGRTRWG